MKNRIIAIIAIFAVFGLAIAAYAYNQNTSITTVGTASCCKNGDSCPMKAGVATAPTDGAAGCDCCGDSCPMKSKSGAAATASSMEEGSNCCANCACCNGKDEKAAV